MTTHRPTRHRAKSKPPLKLAQILTWADAHHERTGSWPKATDGRVGGARRVTWAAVDKSLRRGGRGLAGGSSLARLLSKRRGARNHKALRPYSVAGILAWADAHHSLTGDWPNERSGPIRGSAGETWTTVGSAIRIGARGMPGGSSLARLLAERRGARNKLQLPHLSTAKILSWADAHFKRTGRWPKRNDGSIPESAGENWGAIDTSLRNGRRGLPGGKTLAQLLNERRGVRNHKALSRYSEHKILAWADAHFRRAGTWPTAYSGPVLDASGESWRAVNSALKLGLRGLAGGSSLARLLQRHRGARDRRVLPRLRVGQILSWARAHRRRTGVLPTQVSGQIVGFPGVTWRAVDSALRNGHRGFPGGSSLYQLLKARLGGSPQRKALSPGVTAQ